MIEDRFTRLEEVHLTFGPLGGFKWERFHMPVATYGKRNANAAAKLRMVAHMAILTYSSSNLLQWRIEVKHCCADQGSTERKVPKSVFGTRDGPVKEILEK